jgi:anti-sigma regulatory factor (Ser/Thr protein kinase)
VRQGQPTWVVTTVGVHTYDGRCAQLRRSVRTVGVSTDGHGRAALAACPGLTRAAESSVHPCVRPPGGPDTSPGRGGQGRAVALMTGAVRETMTLAGRAERARVARAFVDGVLGPGHPCGDVATLLVDELFANSIRHSGSGAPGETVTVAVKTADDVIRVEVTDLSGPGVPRPRPSGSEAEDGRGLDLVARLAARWGWRRRGGRTVTWFELCDLLQPMQHSAVSG